MGWWEETWINAWELTKKAEYLNLAEQLWNNITSEGFQADCGLIIQQTATAGGLEDGYANSLYVRDSAWLYHITGWDQYLTGIPEGPGKSVGGAFEVAISIRQDLVVKISGPALGNPTSVFVIAGHAASGCVPAGNQWWLSTQGEMVNAWADLSVADAKYCKAHPGCTDLTGYYKNLADELALSIADNTPPGYSAGAEPTADSNGKLLPAGLADTPAADLASLLDRGVKALFIFAQGDLGQQYFLARLAGQLQPYLDDGRLAVAEIPSTNHTFSSEASRRRLLSLAADWMLGHFEAGPECA